MRQHITAKEKRQGLLKSKSQRSLKDVLKPTHKKNVRIKVLVAIPVKLYQNGICSLLKEQRDIIVKEAEQDWFSALMFLERMHPNIVIISLEMPYLVRKLFLSVIQEKYPKTRVLLVCSQEDDDEIIQALSEGASGYVLAQTGKSGLLKAIKGVYAGQIWTPRRLMGSLLERLRPNKKALLKLSPVDKNVALLLSEGLSDKEISQRLDISFNTVREHLTRIYHVLGVTSRSQAIVKLLQTTQRSGRSR